jgi:hypothetical protein
VRLLTNSGPSPPQAQITGVCFPCLRLTWAIGGLNPEFVDEAAIDFTAANNFFHILPNGRGPAGS